MPLPALSSPHTLGLVSAADLPECADTSASAPIGTSRRRRAGEKERPSGPERRAGERLQCSLMELERKGDTVKRW